MLGKLLKFEFSYQTKQIGFWLVIGIMFALGLVTPTLTDAFGNGLAGQKIKLNGAQMIAGSIVSWDAAVIFFGAIFVVSGILRDRSYNMLEIVHATPVRTRDMTGSRMLGIYVTIFACIFANTIGQFIGQFSPTIDAEIKGAVNPLFYLQPALLFTAVNALIATAFFTLIAGISQNRMLVFVSAIGLFFYSIMTGLLTSIDAPKWLQSVADPFGSLGFSLDTESMTPEERNTHMVPLWGYTGLNRIVWLMISVGILAAIFNRFKRGLVTGKTKIDTKDFRQSEPIKPYQAATIRSGFMADVRAMITRTKFEYLTTVKSIPFMILAGLAATLFAILIVITVFFSPLKYVPTSYFMASIGFSGLYFPMLFIIAFFSGELIWRDRSVKFTELLDSTKVRNWPLLMGKWLALCGVIITLCLIAVSVGMAIQFLAGGPSVDISFYLKYAFLNRLPDYLAIAFLALFVQSFAPNKIVGMLFAAAAMIGVEFIPQLPFYHPLIGFSGTSPGSPSEIAPYNNWIYFRTFNIYFGALCALFAVSGVWLWRRGLQISLLKRFRGLRHQVTPVSGIVAVALTAIFVASGVRIFNAYDKAEWINARTTEKEQAAGERLFATERKLPVPSARAVTVDVQIYPAKQEALISGTVKIENTAGTPISEVYVNASSEHNEDIHILKLEGAIELTSGKNAEGDSVNRINDFNVRVFTFKPPLPPGGTSVMTFETFYHGPRLADRSVIKKNGTFLNNYGTFGASSRVIPTLGAPDLRLRNSKKRRKYGLDELEKLPNRDNREAVQKNIFGMLTGPADYIDFEGTVCTSEDQIPIAPGDFIGETVKDGRRCRNYKSDTPISNFYSFLSGDYVVTKDSWTSPKGKVIPISVFHGKDHTYSVDDMIKSVKFGLTHYSEKFGPYQYNYFRIMEVPFIGFAQAFAGTIPYAEQGFILDSGDVDDVKTLDNAAQTTLHELGHQWFAHQLVPSQTRGFNVLSEGLTSYATMDAYEEMYGWDKARYLLEKGGMGIEGMQAMAFIDREKEVPLGVAGEQLYLFYAKADWVMWGLKHYIGRDNMQKAMKGLLDEFGGKGAPYPTTLDVTAAIKNATSPNYHQLIDDMWERMVWWDIRFGEGDMKITLNSNGTYKVSIPLKIDKKIMTEDMDNYESYADLDGEELNEWIEVGLYENTPKTKWSDWSVLERVQVNSAESTLSFNVKNRPTHVALDPRRLLQERNVTDNVKPLPKILTSAE